MRFGAGRPGVCGAARVPVWRRGPCRAHARRAGRVPQGHTRRCSGPHGAGPAARRELRFYQERRRRVASVRTPRLLDCVDAEDGVAVLLEAAGEPEEPAVMDCGHVGKPGPGSWPPYTACRYRRARAGTAPMRCARPWPTRTWKKIRAFWAPVLPQLADLDSRRVELEDHVGALPPVFIHGDCHTDNIVHSAGSLVFCDWQAAGIGRAVSDLAFLSVRVTPAGVTVPRAPRSTPTWIVGRASAARCSVRCWRKSSPSSSSCGRPSPRSTARRASPTSAAGRANSRRGGS